MNKYAYQHRLMVDDGGSGEATTRDVKWTLSTCPRECLGFYSVLYMFVFVCFSPPPPAHSKTLTFIPIFIVGIFKLKLGRCISVSVFLFCGHDFSSQLRFSTIYTIHIQPKPCNKNISILPSFKDATSFM